jgi:putative SOS response-associated peptidase YedK
MNAIAGQLLLDLQTNLRPRYNIAPTQDVPAVWQTESATAPEVVMLRWGLVPSWAKDPAIGSRMINARCETLAEKPSFRSAFKRRRCLVLSDGYYEWEKEGSGKQPYLIHMQDDRPFAFAGLWEYWEGGPFHSCTVITTDANQATSNLHHRMPVILSPADIPAWLDPSNEDQPALQELLVPYEEDDIIVDRVSKHVNNARHEDAQCVEVQRELF